MELKIFADIQKVDQENRLVYGYASTTALDNQGEIITKAALADALPDYLRFSNIREMHQPSAVGVTEDAHIDDKGLYICAKVVDESAWQKVKEGVYKGFSIGARSLARVKNVIEKLQIREISLVDRPANSECVFEIYKADGLENPSDKWSCGIVDGHEHDSKLDAENCATSKMKKVEAVKTLEAENLNSNDIEKSAEPEEKKQPENIETVNEEKVIDEAPAQKTIETENLEKTSDVKKGMYEVGTLASILDQLNNLRQTTEFEQQIENDISEIPNKLKDAVNALAEILKEMVAEEADEMTENDDNKEVVTDVISNAVKSGDIQKAGARNSRNDGERIQKMHDMSIELGANCSGAESAKFDSINDSDSIKKISTLEDDIKKLSDINADLQKKIDEWSNSPKEPKGILKAIAKGDDVFFDEIDSINTKDPLDLIKIAQRKPMPFSDFIKRS